MTSTLTRTRILRSAILCALAAAFSSANAQTSSVQVIPALKHFTSTEAKFEIGSDTRLALADGQSADDRFAAQDFIEDLKETAGVSLRLGGSGARHEILIGQ